MYLYDMHLFIVNSHYYYYTTFRKYITYQIASTFVFS